MRDLKERYVLKYMEQVEFIRFRDMVMDADTDIRRLKLTIEHLERRKQEALEEIEHLFRDNEKDKDQKPMNPAKEPGMTATKGNADRTPMKKRMIA